MKNYTISRLQIEEAIKKLEVLQTSPDNDQEQDHVDADDILLNLSPEEIRIEYNKIPRWYA